MKPMGTIVAVVALLGVLLAPAIAQKPQSEPPRGPDEELARMMTMMEEQMKQMHEQMKDMQGTGPIQGRMGRMMGMMRRMASMMEEHRDEVRTVCHGERHDRR